MAPHRPRRFFLYGLCIAARRSRSGAAPVPGPDRRGASWRPGADELGQTPLGATDPGPSGFRRSRTGLISTHARAPPPDILHMGVWPRWAVAARKRATLHARAPEQRATCRLAPTGEPGDSPNRVGYIQRRARSPHDPRSSRRERHRAEARARADQERRAPSALPRRAGR